MCNGSLPLRRALTRLRRHRTSLWNPRGPTVMRTAVQRMTAQLSPNRSLRPHSIALTGLAAAGSALFGGPPVATVERTMAYLRGSALRCVAVHTCRTCFRPRPPRTSCGVVTRSTLPASTSTPVGQNLPASQRTAACGGASLCVGIVACECSAGLRASYLCLRIAYAANRCFALP